MKRTLLTLLALCLLTSVAQARMNAQGVLRQADGALIDGELAVTQAGLSGREKAVYDFHRSY